jgi:hypothetical protein
MGFMPVDAGSRIRPWRQVHVLDEAPVVIKEILIDNRRQGISRLDLGEVRSSMA